MQQLEHAARALDWDGQIITDVEVLGARFAAVARVLPDVHRWRSDHGWSPEPDPAWFRFWSEPSSHDHLPVAAVELVGILVPVTKVRRALQACGTLMTLAPCTVVLPYDHPYKVWPMIELDYYGIGVVAAGDEGGRLILEPEDRRAEFGSSLFGRWLLEVMYSKAIEHEPEDASLTGF